MGCLKLRFKGDNNTRLGLETTSTGVMNCDELTSFQHVNGLVKKKFPIHDVIDEALQVKFHCGRNQRLLEGHLVSNQTFVKRAVQAVTSIGR